MSYTRDIFFNDTATTEIYSLSLHDALPIWFGMISKEAVYDKKVARMIYDRYSKTPVSAESIRERSEEHTSELQSRQYLVCRLLLEKNKCYQQYLFAAFNLNISLLDIMSITA